MTTTRHPAYLTLVPGGCGRQPLPLVAPRRRRPAASAGSVVRVLDRRGLLESVERLGKIAPEAPLSFLIVIVDGLDAIGEVEADLTMRLVAGRLRSLTRATDAVGKLSGSAFGVLLQGTGSTAAGAVAARLSYHVGNVLRGIHAELGVRVTAATGTGVNWPTLPVAAAESLPDAG